MCPSLRIIRYATLTRQTIVPQRLHPPTISRAQLLTLPAPTASRPCSRKYQSAARALYLNVCSGSGSISSFTQCSVEARSCLRNWSRLARIWRQVIANASRVLRSMCEAIDVMILERARVSPLHPADTPRQEGLERRGQWCGSIGGRGSRIAS